MTPAAKLALSKIENVKPKDEKGLLALGFTLKQLGIGSGSFRDVYLIVGTGLIAKVPQTWNLKRCRRHSTLEVQAVRKVLRAKRGPLVALQKHMPEIYYSGARSGVVVMKRYKQVTYAKRFRQIGELSRSIGNAFHSSFPDIHDSNVGVDDDGTLVVLDGGRMFGIQE